MSLDSERTPYVACEVRSCTSEAATSVTLHNRRVPEYYRVCNTHAAELEASDQCRVCGKQRAESYATCPACLRGRERSATPKPTPRAPCTPAPLASTPATATATEPPSPDAIAPASATATTATSAAATTTTTPTNETTTVSDAGPATSASSELEPTSRTARPKGRALQAEILRLLAQTPDGLSAEELIEIVGGEPARIYNAIRSMREKRQIAATIRHGAPGNRWRLAEPQVTPADAWMLTPADAWMLRAQVHDVLRASECGLPVSSIALRVKAHAASVRRALRSLRVAGEAEATQAAVGDVAVWRLTTSVTPGAPKPFVPDDESAARLGAIRIGLAKLANLVDDDASPDECVRVARSKTDETLLGIVRLELMSGLNKVSALSAALMPLYEIAGVPVGDGTELFLVFNQAVRRMRAAAEVGVTWDATVDGPVARLPEHPRMNEALLEALTRISDLQGDLDKARADLRAADNTIYERDQAAISYFAKSKERNEELRRLHEAAKDHGELARRYHELACRLYGVDPDETSTHPAHEHLVERIEAMLTTPKPPIAQKDTRILAVLRARVASERADDLIANALLAMVDDLSGAVS